MKIKKLSKRNKVFFTLTLFLVFIGSMNKIQGHEILVELDSSAPWGQWTGFQRIPDGYFACGMEQRIEPRQGKGDDTTMNGIRFYYCLWDEPGGGTNNRNEREKGLIRTLPYGLKL